MKQKGSRTSSSESVQQRLPGLGRSMSALFKRVAAPLNSREGKAEEDKQRSFQELFLLLPEELHVQILGYLDLFSVLNLRITSRSLFGVVQSCEPAYIRLHVQRTSPWRTSLYPLPASSERTLRYLLDYYHRYAVSLKLAARLLLPEWPCGHELKGVFTPSTKDGKDCKCGWWTALRVIASDLFSLNHFLETYRDIILRRALTRVNCSGNNKSNFAFVLGTTDWQDQSSILELTSSRQLARGFSEFASLLDDLDWSLVRINSESRGPFHARNSSYVSSMDIATLLLIGGFHHTLKIVSHSTLTARKQALHRFLHSLTPSNKDWKAAWMGLMLPSDIIAQLDKVPYAKIGIPSLKVLWLQPALRLLIDRNVLREKDMKWRNTRMRAQFTEPGRRCWFLLCPITARVADEDDGVLFYHDRS
ncbi:hypothetical protein NA57DRAFT_81583 [Rhizodiscina lignyota]|uniref:F-box domain-containing protein n=1 Tax=Rhizodiscina lignyota TaxID=1504668 RepID=A0A9P4I1G4_9PEZI|nr:hypothetical protein NA57DRAFT_81583 [Rhizodiscina lignyota]